LLGLLLGLGSLRAATPAQDRAAAFAEAKLLYEQGAYAKAAQAFDRLWTNGVSTVALHFNLGNAWLKAGEPGRAIFHYRLAERLAPRDRDVQTNLRLARTVVAGRPPSPPPWWRRVFLFFTLNEWAGAVAGALWLWMLLRTVGFLRPEWWPRWRLATRGLAILTLTLGLGLGIAWSLHPGPEAVVITQATLRHGPLDASPSLQKLKPGQELQVVERRNGWALVDGAPRGIGWVPEHCLAFLPR
jgi:tetratricopeptide (TPR) repeat protein